MEAMTTAITRCSFCAKEEPEIEQMIAGPGVCICNECVSLCSEIFAAGKGVSGEAELPYWQSMSDEELLAQLPRIASVVAQVEDNLQIWVQRLRDRKVSWARIGQSLGMARQSAWERFSDEP